MAKHFIKPLLFNVFIAILLLLTACAQKDFTFGDRIILNSETAFELGKEWQKGEKMVQKGEQLIKEGKKEINKGETKVKDGEQLVKNGAYLMKNAETRYELLYPDQTQTVPSGK
jgi:exonuclease VII small subunit